MANNMKSCLLLYADFTNKKIESSGEIVIKNLKLKTYLLKR